MSRILLRSILPVFALVLAACGTVAPNVWEVTEDAPQSEVVAIPTRVPPSATPLPPTATLPPTSTPLPTATFTPSPMPPTATVAATVAPTTASTGGMSEGVEPLPAGFAEAVGAADASAGQTIFNNTFTMPSGQPWACSSCHSVTPDEARLIGPGLWNLANRAGERVPGEDQLTYIYDSIRHPNQFIVPPDASGAPYPPNLMPDGYAEVLTEADFANLIAYLLTLQ